MTDLAAIAYALSSEGVPVIIDEDEIVRAIARLRKSAEDATRERANLKEKLAAMRKDDLRTLQGSTDAMREGWGLAVAVLEAWREPNPYKDDGPWTEENLEVGRVDWLAGEGLVHGTCDWGDCDESGAGFANWKREKWIPVCSTHLSSAREEGCYVLSMPGPG